MPVDMNAVALGGLSGRYRFFDSMNCRLQSSRLCNRCMRSSISWQSRKSKTTLSTVRLEKRKKNC